MATTVNFEAILHGAGFAGAGTCQCGGSTGRIFRKGQYEVKVWPYRNPPQYAINYHGTGGNTRGLAAGTIEGLQQAINQHVT